MENEEKGKEEVDCGCGCGCFTFLIGLAAIIFCIALGLLMCKYAWKFLEYVLTMQ